MCKYKRKSVAVEAMQYDPSKCIHRDFLKAFNYDEHGDVFIQAPQGRLTISPGDWIIKGLNGGFYVCSPDAFKTNYEKVEESKKEKDDTPCQHFSRESIHKEGNIFQSVPWCNHKPSQLSKP